MKIGAIYAALMHGAIHMNILETVKLCRPEPRSRLNFMDVLTITYWLQFSKLHNTKKHSRLAGNAI